MPRPEAVLVTGGTGLLGRHVVTTLRAAGDEVRVLARPGSEVPPGCDVVRGDVTDAGVVRTALRSVRAVYHLAAITQKWLRDRREFTRVNVDAAVGLARLAADAGVERVVHVSSFTVFGPSPLAGGPIDEHAVGDPATLQNDYQRSKHAAHTALADMARRGAVPVVLACPGVVYGTGPRHLRNPVADLVQRQLAGRLRGFPGLDRRWTLAWAPDVARGLRLLRAGGRNGDSYLLGGEVAALRSVFRWVEEHSGRRVPRQLPLWPFLAAGRAVQCAARLVQSSRPPRLSAAAMRFLRHSWAFSSAKAEALGYPTTPLGTALRILWADLHARQLVTHAPPAPVSAA